jgi:hypothetical protein
MQSNVWLDRVAGEPVFQFVFAAPHAFDVQRKFSLQTSEFWANVHGLSCHYVNHKGGNSSSQVAAIEESNGGSWGRKRVEDSPAHLKVTHLRT